MGWLCSLFTLRGDLECLDSLIRYSTALGSLAMPFWHTKWCRITDYGQCVAIQFRVSDTCTTVQHNDIERSPLNPFHVSIITKIITGQTDTTSSFALHMHETRKRRDSPSQSEGNSRPEPHSRKRHHPEPTTTNSSSSSAPMRASGTLSTLRVRPLDRFQGKCAQYQQPAEIGYFSYDEQRNLLLMDDRALVPRR